MAFLGFPRMEIVFSVTAESDYGFVAGCLSHDIFIQGNDSNQMQAHVTKAIDAYFFEQKKSVFEPVVSRARKSCGRIVKLPPNLSGCKLIALLCRNFECREINQVGNCILLEIDTPRHH